MAQLVLSEAQLHCLLEQAKTVGNQKLVAELEQAIRDARRLKSPTDIEDWQDAREAFESGSLTIRKDSVRQAASLLYTMADANPALKAKVLPLFSKALRKENGTQEG